MDGTRLDRLTFRDISVNLTRLAPNKKPAMPCAIAGFNLSPNLGALLVWCGDRTKIQAALPLSAWVEIFQCSNIPPKVPPEALSYAVSLPDWTQRRGRSLGGRCSDTELFGSFANGRAVLGPPCLANRIIVGAGAPVVWIRGSKVRILSFRSVKSRGYKLLTCTPFLSLLYVTALLQKNGPHGSRHYRLACAEPYLTQRRAYGYFSRFIFGESWLRRDVISPLPWAGKDQYC